MEKNINLDEYYKTHSMYDKQIKYDISHLPKYLQECIKELEELDEKHDWIKYDCAVDSFEMQAKACLVNNGITARDFKILMRKYGGYLD